MSKIEQLEILVVDDDPEIREVFQELIEGKGHRVTTASGGLEALRAYVDRVNGKNTGSKPFDLVFTDLSMPRVTGYHVTKTVKALSKNPNIAHPTYVCIVTGFEATDEYREMETRLGIYKPDYKLQKPFTFAEVTKVMDDVAQKIGK